MKIFTIMLKNCPFRNQRKILFFLCALLILDVLPGFAQLSGTYTICSGSSCGYSSIGAAVSDLKSKGINGAVTFNVASGTYSENISFPSITGSSATNTITFKGQGRGKTILKGTTGSDVLALNGPSYITIDGFTIQNTISTGNTISFNSTYTCSILNSNSIAVSGASVNNIYSYSSDYSKINNCYIYGGGYGINFTGTAGTSSAPIGNLSFTNNRVTGFATYGIFVLNNGGYAAFYDTYSNNVLDSCSSGASFGIYTKNESGAIYNNNKILASVYYGAYLYYPNYYSSTTPFQFYNNFITAFSYYGIFAYNWGSGSQIQIVHNTLFADSVTKGYTALYTYGYGSTNAFTIQNNIIEMLNATSSTNYGAITIAGNSGGYVTVDGNNIYAPGNSNQGYGNIFGYMYPDFASYVKAMKFYGWESHASNIKPVYIKPPYNLHLNQTKPAPFAPYVGIGVDIDGDSRCKIFPTSGADESSYGKSASLLKIIFPANTYPNSPTIITQNGKASEPKLYHWYLNGVKVSDSAILLTNKFKVGVNTVKLVTQTCANIDSVTANDTVVAPKYVPVVDFLSSANKLIAGDVVTLTDVSTNGPTSWAWVVTPASTTISGVKTATYKYVNGSSASYNPQIQFLIPGKYSVCLTTGNGVSNGKQVCKNNYITVYSSVNISNPTSQIHDATGFLFDDGGPNAAYKSNGGTASAVIDPCADSVYMYFTSFDVNCGFGSVMVYEGRDNTGKILDKCSTGYTGGPGSSTCSVKCLPNLVTDTFKAKNTMYIEMTDNANNGSAGFSIFWWSKPKTSKKPTAAFSTTNPGDSVCVNHNMSYVNNTKIDQNDPASFLWDLDGDLSTVECVGNCATATYPYYKTQLVKITLIATNCGGSDTASKTITVYVPKSPVAGFLVDNQSPTLNDVAFLSPDVKMCIDDFKWTITKTSGTGTAYFANGTSNTSVSPQIMFSDTGFYDVSLYVDNASGFNNTLTKTKFIHVRQPYCIPSASNTLKDIGITNVVFNTINNKTKPAQADYTNFVNIQSLSTTVEMGLSYVLTVKRDSPSFNPMTRTAYIDWNCNTVFEASDVLGVDSNSYVIGWNKKIKVPKNAKTGASILRVAVTSGSSSNAVCGQNAMGEYQDYRVYITPYHTLPVLTLKGQNGLKDTIFIENGFNYTEQGFSAYSLLNGDVSSMVKVKSSKITGLPYPGGILMSYNVTDSGGLSAITQYRVIKFTIDKTPPVLVITGKDTIGFEVYTKVTLPTVLTVSDLVTKKLVVTIDTSALKSRIVGYYPVKYSVKDSAGNATVVICTIHIMDTIAPVIKLKGKATDTMVINTSYVDPGVSTSDNYYSSTQLDTMVIIESNLDTSNYGTYTTTYNLKDPSGNIAKQVARKIVIYDQIPPVIKVKGNQIDSIPVFTTYKDPGYTTYDNLDNPSQLKVTITGTFYTAFPTGLANITGIYTIIYTSKDRIGNSSSITRTVKVKDYIAPVIHLVGANIVSVCRWAKYTDGGYTLSDNYDQNSDITVTTFGTFTTKGGTTVEGLYSLQYVATDRAGNMATSETRAIQVDPYYALACKSGIVQGLNLDKYINIYPNPANGHFNFTANLPKAEKLTMKIVDILGKTIWQSNETDNQISSDKNIAIDVSNQVNGMYYLSISTENETVVKKIEILK